MADCGAKVTIVLDDEAKGTLVALNDVVNALITCIANLNERIDKLNDRIDGLEGELK